MLFGPESPIAASIRRSTTGMLIARWTPLRRTQPEMHQPRKSVLVLNMHPRLSFAVVGSRFRAKRLSVCPGGTSGTTKEHFNPAWGTSHVSIRHSKAVLSNL